MTDLKLGNYISYKDSYGWNEGIIIYIENSYLEGVKFFVRYIDLRLCLIKSTRWFLVKHNSEYLTREATIEEKLKISEYLAKQ